MGLKKFKNQNHQHKIILVLVICCLLGVASVFFYKTYAVYQVTDNKNIIEGMIKDPGDLYFTFYVDGNISKTIPEKNDGYVYDSETSYCTNNSTLLWDKVDWAPIIENLSSTRTKCTIHFKTAYIETLLNGMEPILDDTGMIPVTIQSDGTVTTANLSDSWYSYENKQWANAVLVKENGTKTRSYYLTNRNQTVNLEDILAYYVWIPQFSYKINDAETSISISFGEEVPNNYKEHPAFDFDGSISGFWIGKFETTQGTEANIGVDYPTCLPNTTSWVLRSVSTQFQDALKYAGGNLSSGNVSFQGSSLYGLSSTTNSHMMKNSEWGAAAYLAYSVYGINQEIRINNYYNNYLYLTGCGAAEGVNTPVTDCSIKYGSVSEYPQSSTGNISGVFDMSGGVYEYVMGILADTSGYPRSGKDTTANSGFNGALLSGTYESGISYPTNSIYYDVYSSSDMSSSCADGACDGHALSETSEWHGDFAMFVTENSSWFVRGGDYYDEALAGVFSYNRTDGAAGSSSGWRPIIIVK